MLLKMGTIDWSMVRGGVMAFAVIALVLAPVFWWLYDTDRWTRWTDRVGDSPAATIVLLVIWPWNAYRAFERGTILDFFFGAVLVVCTLLLVWRAIKAGGNLFKAP